MGNDGRKCSCSCQVARRQYSAALWAIVKMSSCVRTPPMLNTRTGFGPPQMLLDPPAPVDPTTNPPPPYAEACRSSAPTLAAKTALAVCSQQTRVAAMPRARPGPDIEYLSIIDGLPPPIEFDMCKPCARKSHVSRLSRYLSSRLHTFLAKGVTVMCVRIYYYDAERRKLVLRIIYGLSHGDIERFVTGPEDWPGTLPGLLPCSIGTLVGAGLWKAGFPSADCSIASSSLFPGGTRPRLEGTSRSLAPGATLAVGSAPSVTLTPATSRYGALRLRFAIQASRLSWTLIPLGHGITFPTRRVRGMSLDPMARAFG